LPETTIRDLSRLRLTLTLTATTLEPPNTIGRHTMLNVNVHTSSNVTVTGDGPAHIVVDDGTATVSIELIVESAIAEVQGGGKPRLMGGPIAEMVR
jgi:hypothetical protein